MNGMLEFNNLSSSPFGTYNGPFKTISASNTLLGMFREFITKSFDGDGLLARGPDTPLPAN